MVKLHQSSILDTESRFGSLIEFSHGKKKNDWEKNYQKFLVIIFSALLTIFFSSNSYGAMWEKTFGGNADDRGNSVRETTDGGYIIAGHTESSGAGHSDVYLIYYNEGWETVYTTLFDNPSDLEFLRQYRDVLLSNTTKGVIYKTLLYLFSKQAL